MSAADRLAGDAILAKLDAMLVTVRQLRAESARRTVPQVTRRTVPAE